MTIKKDSRGRTRDYRKEYLRDHASPAQRAARARRNRDRAKAEKQGRVHKGDGKDVHHTKGNARGPTRVVSRHYNRGEANRRR